MAETIIIKGTGITLDLLLWRRFGVHYSNMVEEVLRLNPLLAKKGPVIPLGTEVILPDAPPPAAPKVKLISLFE